MSMMRKIKVFRHAKRKTDTIISPAAFQRQRLQRPSAAAFSYTADTDGEGLQQADCTLQVLTRAEEGQVQQLHIFIPSSYDLHIFSSLNHLHIIFISSYHIFIPSSYLNVIFISSYYLHIFISSSYLHVTGTASSSSGNWPMGLRTDSTTLTSLMTPGTDQFSKQPSLESMQTNLPVPYDLCVGIPISHLLTVFQSKISFQ